MPRPSIPSVRIERRYEVRPDTQRILMRAYAHVLPRTERPPARDAGSSWEAAGTPEERRHG